MSTGAGPVVHPVVDWLARVAEVRAFEDPAGGARAVRIEHRLLCSLTLFDIPPAPCAVHLGGLAIRRGRRWACLVGGGEAAFATCGGGTAKDAIPWILAHGARSVHVPRRAPRDGTADTFRAAGLRVRPGRGRFTYGLALSLARRLRGGLWAYHHGRVSPVERTTLDRNLADLRRGRTPLLLDTTLHGFALRAVQRDLGDTPRTPPPADPLACLRGVRRQLAGLLRRGRLRPPGGLVVPVRHGGDAWLLVCDAEEPNAHPSLLVRTGGDSPADVPEPLRATVLRHGRPHRRERWHVAPPAGTDGGDLIDCRADPRVPALLSRIATFDARALDLPVLALLFRGDVVFDGGLLCWRVPRALLRDDGRRAACVLFRQGDGAILAVRGVYARAAGRADSGAGG